MIKWSKLKNANWVIHPVLFALYFVLSLLASNIAIVASAGVRAVIVSVGASLFFIVLLNLVLEDIVKSGLIASGAIMLISSYGHIKNLISSRALLNQIIGRDVILLPIWGIILGVWVYVVLKKLKDTEVVSGYFNWVSVIVNFFPIYTIVTFVINANAARPWVQDYIAQAHSKAGVSCVEEMVAPPAEEPVPDVYYIILDAYTRADVLDELYDYDNSYFVDFLEQRGFYVAEESTANYMHTDLSLPSSLNMVHINTMPDFFHQHTNLNDVSVLRGVVTGKLARTSKVKRTFQNLGYEIVTFEGGYGSNIGDVDMRMRSPDIESGEGLWQVGFEVMLLDTSLGQVYIRLKGENYGPLQRSFATHREQITFALENLPNFAQAEGDYFVFAHILSPHVPYVFGPNGEEIKQNDPYTLLAAHPGQEENIVYYRDQLHYLNTLVMDTIDRILADSEVPPIIILQSDHSSKVYNDANPPGDVKMKLSFPILNAYHLPGEGAEALYPTITPVNSFRVIFNHYFDANLDLLEDTSYVLDENAGEFVEACEFYHVCSPE